MIPIFRSRHAAEYTARGVANGVFWALTPSVGGQTLAIVATWFLLRKLLRRDSSLVQAFIWAWVNNPITMIPLYYTFYATGLWLTGNAGGTGDYTAFAALWNSQANASWMARIAAIFAAIGVPLLIGCIPYAVIGTALSYRWALKIIRRRRQRLEARMTLKPDLSPDAPAG